MRVRRSSQNAAAAAKRAGSGPASPAAWHAGDVRGAAWHAGDVCGAAAPSRSRLSTIAVASTKSSSRPSRSTAHPWQCASTNARHRFDVSV